MWLYYLCPFCSRSSAIRAPSLDEADECSHKAIYAALLPSCCYAYLPTSCHCSALSLCSFSSESWEVLAWGSQVFRSWSARVWNTSRLQPLTPPWSYPQTWCFWGRWSYWLPWGCTSLRYLKSKARSSSLPSKSGPHRVHQDTLMNASTVWSYKTNKWWLGLWPQPGLNDLPLTSLNGLILVTLWAWAKWNALHGDYLRHASRVNIVASHAFLL